MKMSSSILLAISLVSILIIISNSDNYMKDSICDLNKNYIDSIIQFENKRYFVIDNKFFEYDNNYNFRRRGDLYFEMQDIDKMDSQLDNLESFVKFGKFLSGFFIPKINCQKLPKDSGIQQNCSTVLDKTLSHLMVFVVYDQFSNKYVVRSKKFNKITKIFEGIPDCQLETNDSSSKPAGFNIDLDNIDSSTEYDGYDDDDDNGDQPNNSTSNGTDDGEGEGEDDSTSTTVRPNVDPNKQKELDFNDNKCGAFRKSGKTTPKDWLINGILNADQFKFLPVFFDENKLEILIIFNKEYRFFGDTENPSPIRTDAKVWWKRITFNDSKYGWKSKIISNENTYTAFLKQGNDLFLIAEPFKERHKERGPSMMLKFDLTNKELIEKSTNKNPLELFGCSFGSDDWIGYVIIAILLSILLLVMIGWIFACYWFYARDEKTTYNQSVEIENT